MLNNRLLLNNMLYFNESQLEQAFVELFNKEGYDYVHGESILRDTRDVILYDDLRLYLRKKYKTDHITEDEINRAIAKLETSDGGGVYAENVEALRLLQGGFSLKRTNPKLPNLHIYRRCDQCNLMVHRKDNKLFHSRMEL